MEEHNRIQKKLVEDCETVHKIGIRHSGLSGSICENLLLKQLRKSIPELNFDRGIIKCCNPKSKGHDIKNDGDLSGQIDIIIYNGNHLRKIEDVVVVHKDNVFGAIEVKKWTQPSMLKSKNSVYKKISNTKKLLKNEVPLFFVTFRYHDRVKDETNWFKKIEHFSTKYAYCFYGNWRHFKGESRYPWEKDNPPEEIKKWDNFEEDCPYHGQYNQLVDDIKELCK